MCLYQHSTSHSSQGAAIAVFPEEPPSLGLITDLCPAESNGELASLDTQTFSAADEYPFLNEALFDNVPLPTTQESACGGEYGSLDILSHPQDTTINLDHRYQMNLSNFSPFQTLVPQPIFRAPRAFKPRTLAYRQLSLIRKFVICTLGSYPQMLLPGKDLPPFLHPQCLSREFDRNKSGSQASFLGPLATCSGIVAMWSVKNKNNSAFIWHSIHTEQEKISKEVCAG